MTAQTIDVGKIILREIQNCARHFGLAYFPFTITVLCLKAKIFANVKKTGYSQGTIMDWDLFRVARNSILQQQAESSDELKGEEVPTEIEPMQPVEIPNPGKPTEPIFEPNMATPTFRTRSPCPDPHDELSKLMDIMQHMQWQQQAYWRY